MSEPTMEQMIEAVKAIYPDAEECFYRRYGVLYRGIVTELTLAEQLHDGDVVPRNLWLDAYNRLPAPEKPVAPHDPAEGFDEWWSSAKDRDYLNPENTARAAWIASAERKERNGR